MFSQEVAKLQQTKPLVYPSLISGGPLQNTNKKSLTLTLKNLFFSVCLRKSKKKSKKKNDRERMCRI